MSPALRLEHQADTYDTLDSVIAHPPEIESDAEKTRKMIAASLLWNLDNNKGCVGEGAIGLETISPDKQSYYHILLCDTAFIEIPKKFTMSGIESLQEYVINARLDHESKFCLGSIESAKTYRSGIVYTVGSGAHHSDALSLVVTDQDLSKASWLMITGHYGKEGYESLVESQIDKDMVITRVVTETFGSYNMKKQPMRITSQKFMMTSQGEITLVFEKEERINFDEYLNPSKGE